MSHGITKEDRAVYARTSAWHNLGRVSDRQLTIAEAVKELDFDVLRVPLNRSDNGNAVPFYANVNSRTGATLGVVSERYSLITMAKLERIIEIALFNLKEDYSAECVDAAFSLWGGKVVCFSLRDPSLDWEIAGTDDCTTTHILISNENTGAGFFEGCGTTQRTECANMRALHLSMAKERGQLLKMRHVGGVDAEVAAVALSDIITMTRLRIKGESVFANKLAGIIVSSDSLNDYYTQLSHTLYGIDTEENEAVAIRAQWKDGMDFRAQRLRKISGTAWAALNTATGWLQHKANRRGNRELSAVMGSASKQIDAAYAVAHTMFD